MNVRLWFWTVKDRHDQEPPTVKYVSGWLFAFAANPSGFSPTVAQCTGCRCSVVEDHPENRQVLRGGIVAGDVGVQHIGVIPFRSDHQPVGRRKLRAERDAHAVAETGGGARIEHGSRQLRDVFLHQRRFADDDRVWIADAVKAVGNERRVDRQAVPRSIQLRRPFFFERRQIGVGDCAVPSYPWAFPVERLRLRGAASLRQAPRESREAGRPRRHRRSAAAFSGSSHHASRTTP